MTPDFLITVEGNNITPTVAAGLLSLTVSDEAGIASDKLEIRLDDSKGLIALPATGAELEIALGYKETGLAVMGRYTVDEIFLEGEPKVLGIRAKAADMGQSFKSPKTRSWDSISLGNMVGKIATEHRLEPRVAEELTSIQIEHIDQTESDLNLLTRIARQHDAVAKPVGGFLVFVPRGEAKSAAGITLDEITLHSSEITSWSATFADRGKFGSVKGQYHNTQAANKEAVTVGEGEPVYTLKHTHENATQAKQAAEAQLGRFSRGKGTLNLTLPGNTRLMAEAKLNILGIREGVDGQWVIKKVDHQLDSGGYSCRVDAETQK